jgi:hypothetical protein
MNPIMYMFLYATKIIEYAILGEHSWFEHCKVYNLDFFYFLLGLNLIGH